MPVQHKTAVIIVNEKCGGHSRTRIAHFAQCLRGAGFVVDIVPTAFRGHATALARKAVHDQKYTHIVAAGGDGTIAEIAEGMAGSDCILGILPLGTANVLAHELGIPSDDADSAGVMARGNSRVIWPGHLQSDGWNGLFIQMAGIGFDAHVVHAVSTRLKSALGQFAYVLNTVRSLWRYGFEPLHVLLDGVEYDAVSVIVSKGSLYAGKYVLTRDSMLAEKRFSVVLFRAPGILATLRASLSLLRGNLARQRDVEIHTARCIEIRTPPGIPVQSDGDARQFTPVRIDIAERPIRIVSA
ncbi:diacylglycerol kinase [Komagataeibacter saccharivorans]|uniref:diacylglycerol/lipid kinase family protein n=1 Tax=Komagataeibacter saccharivorans TaxID=265959 RepID=UPI000D7CAC2D|nr:diacylglycerol kinase family protein [Komagataeibacter saccharivorans]PYD50476.1 diacylglycerol kinase [Komagataeibacter saccharivorans]